MTPLEAVDWGSVGTGLQLVGVGATGLGAWQTWQEFGEPGHFWDFVTLPLAAAWRRLALTFEGIARRVLRRPKAVVVGIGTINVGAATLSARARVQFGELPATTKAAIAELHRRTKELGDRLSDAREETADGLAAVREEFAELAAQVEVLSADLDQRTRRVAVHGIRLEAAGLLFVAAGTLLQSLAG